ncbi:MAG: YeeE/YedE family protein [Desulfovibrio sp.]|nr:MAG: YeeE/YedE family protein [Desulfovibrio sp.]
MTLLYGLITGLVFGFLLQKSRVIRYDKQIGALRLMDMTIVKFMLSFIIVAMVGVYLLREFGVVELSLKGTILGPNIIGGLLFGLGWGLIGYCPGTAAGALGEGRVDALAGILGMLVGASVFSHTYPTLKASVYTWGDFGKITLADLLGVNHWVIIAGLVVVYVLVLAFIERKNL